MSTPRSDCERLNVVVPARGEGDGLGAMLTSLLAGAEGLSLLLIVILNGEGQDEMASSLAPLFSVFAEKGHRLVSVKTSKVGKAAALNLGDEFCDPHVSIVYLDADCWLIPGTLQALSQALHVQAPRLAGPRISPVAPAAWFVRDYLEIWKQLPSIRGQLIGAGCYAVNPLGRSRWGRFPDEMPDDAFVRCLFTKSERAIIEEGGALFIFPDTCALSDTLRRWAAGNKRLRRAGFNLDGPGASRFKSGPVWLLKQPRLWRRMPALLFAHRANIFSFKSARSKKWTDWRPNRVNDLAARDCQHSFFSKSRIAVVIVSYNSGNDICACLASLVTHSAKLEIRVVDNASTDDTLESIGRLVETGKIKLTKMEKNIGFARAVNHSGLPELQSSDVCETNDYLLLVNPDVELKVGAIDALLTLARRFPAAGLYGGQMLNQDGRIDPGSCLALPTFFTALRFAFGTNFLRGWPWFDADSLGGWQRDDSREVPALTGGLLLIDTELWRLVGGFDSRFFLYGEDLDLCQRARKLGARPMMTNLCQYRHRGGASSTSDSDRFVQILRGQAEIHLRLPCARMRRILLLAGVALRAKFEAFGVGPSGKRWQECWARRNEWSNGWSAELL